MNIDETIEMKKDILCKRFKRKLSLAEELYSKKCIDLSEKIIAELKKQELTYEEAYATLEVVYSQLEYESNFIHLLNK